jgi:hypothetical protein
MNCPLITVASRRLDHEKAMKSDMNITGTWAKE